VSLTIERLGHRGDGIAPGPIYAALTLPGEVVDGEVEGGRIARPKIVTPSPERIKPVCRHFNACGGCALQHGSNGFVAGWKVDQVRDALALRGLDAPVRHVATSSGNSRRRATFSARRTKKSAMAGFHARASSTIVETPDCQLVVPEIAALASHLAEFAVIGTSRRAELALTVTWTDTGADVSVTGGVALDRPLQAKLAALASRLDLARLTWNRDVVVQVRPPTVAFDDVDVVLPPGAFLQATVHGEMALRAAVGEAVAGATRVVDLFSGCGTFALPLARAASVTAVEGDAAALYALDRAWRHSRGMKAVETEVRDLFRRPLLPDELRRFDAVVIDPPRAGAEAQMAEIARAGVARVAAVSCNPVSFARDAEILTTAGYRIEWIDVVDQFRWSPHVELAALLLAPDI